MNMIGVVLHHDTFIIRLKEKLVEADWAFEQVHGWSDLADYGSGPG